jgi:hypothetical protein
VLLQMEAVALRRIWVYSLAGVVLGMLLVLLPLVTLVGTGTENHHTLPALFSNTLKGLEGSSSDRSKSEAPELEGLAVSFAIAVFAFMFLRRRRPQSERHMFGQLPY